MKFKRVDPGTIEIKSNNGKKTIQASETYLIGRYEVPQQQYASIMRKNPSGFKDESDSGVTALLPVENVSWQDAKDFVDRLNQALPMRTQIEFGENWEYALPLSSDWEYAFFYDLKKKDQKFCDYDHILKNIDSYAWYDKNSNKKTHPVGEKESISFLYDMLGNVAEWCEEDYIHSSGKQNEFKKILKGGNWSQSFLSKYVFNPTYILPAKAEEKGKNIGFRVVIKKKIDQTPPKESEDHTVVQDRKRDRKGSRDLSPLGAEDNDHTHRQGPKEIPQEDDPEIIDKSSEKDQVKKIPYAVYNESYEFPLYIYRKDPVRETCNDTTDIVTLQPRGIYSFVNEEDKAKDIYILKTREKHVKYTLHPSKMIGFSFDLEKFQWNATYTSSH